MYREALTLIELDLSAPILRDAILHQLCETRANSKATIEKQFIIQIEKQIRPNSPADQHRTQKREKLFCLRSESTEVEFVDSRCFLELTAD